jgi:hypothetical protein
MGTVNEHLTVVAMAIRSTRAIFPASGFGSMRDQIYEPSDQSLAFAQAVLVALDAAGYKIVPKDSADA